MKIFINYSLVLEKNSIILWFIFVKQIWNEKNNKFKKVNNINN